MTENPSSAAYDEEIDLRQVIQALLDGWRWVAVATLIGGLGALIVCLLLPRRYEASSVIVLTRPDVVFTFDPRITTEFNVPPDEGLPDLVSSDEVLAGVISQTASAGAGGRPVGLAQLRERAAASVSGAVITLKIQDRDPERSAAMANAWAGIAAERLNNVYAPSAEATGSYEAQSEEAFSRWEEAQQSLVSFQSTNKEGFLGDELASLHADLQSHLDAERLLGLAIMDARSLMARLAEQGSAYDPRNDLASLLLVLRSLTSSSGMTQTGQGRVVGQGADGSQLLLQIDENSLLSGSVDEQRSLLADLIDSMESQQSEHGQTVADLEAKIPQVQGDLARAQEARQTLETERDLARETYQALARKAQESRLASAADASIAKVASESLVPVEPIERRTQFWVVIGVIGGVFLSSFWILTVRWWRDQASS